MEKINGTPLSALRFARIRDALIALDAHPKIGDAQKAKFGNAFLFTALILFAVIISVWTFLPATIIGTILSFAISLLIVVSVSGTALWLFFNRIEQHLKAITHRFEVRTQILHQLAADLGLSYCPVPGGVSPILLKIASWPICPPALNRLIVSLDGHGEMSDFSAPIRESGLAMPREVVLGSQKSKDKYYEQQKSWQQFEDGFTGQLNGISFSAVEWAESNEDATIYHLLIALQLPIHKTARTEFRTQKAPWPAHAPTADQMRPVRLQAGRFAKTIKVRSTDQVEAHWLFDPAVSENLASLGLTNEISGAAFGSHLVVDIAGNNRFDIIDVITGEWDDERIVRTMDDIKNMKSFVSAVADAFTIRPDATSRTRGAA